MLTAGFASAALGLWLLAMSLEAPMSPAFMFGIALSGIGHGLIYPAMFAVGLTAVPAHQQGRASALMITSQYIAGAMMLAIISVLLGAKPDLTAWSVVFHLLCGAAVAGMLIALCSREQR
ncbi:hypothetical protein PF050_20535 [Kosakonia pseudosacchari]|uniref:hypothetical protein n=1 Tax=Kosakonia pseudosacchari TaxID=1646340 RepID=UPI0022F03543|nr:hypothetical protein [Kosakonia pseudosacchari]WBU48815.1 hypothetical protein PF050_20535 [Kosakonia pseudosacchari]